MITAEGTECFWKYQMKAAEILQEDQDWLRDTWERLSRTRFILFT